VQSLLKKMLKFHSLSVPKRDENGVEKTREETNPITSQCAPAIDIEETEKSSRRGERGTRKGQEELHSIREITGNGRSRQWKKARTTAHLALGSLESTSLRRFGFSSSVNVSR
jgi:hypothetical protein